MKALAYRWQCLQVGPLHGAKRQKKEDPEVVIKMADNERSPQSVQLDSPKLSELLDQGWSVLDQLENTQEPLASVGVQERLQRAIRDLESASRRVAQLELFSRNEELEEVCTSELKYLLLPALLGALSLKQTSRDRRLDILNTARAYFVDYLQRCKNYNVSKFHMPKSCEECEEEQPLPSAPVSVDLHTQCLHLSSTRAQFSRSQV